MAILTAIALIIFIVEAQIPLPVPIPGVKLGLANAVTLFALFYGANMAEGSQQSKVAKSIENTENTANTTELSPRASAEPSPCVPLLSTANVLAILLCRILLGAVFTGRPVALLYSLAGGLLGFAALVIMKRLVTNRLLWVCGAIGAVFHNIGQIAAAVFITGTPAIAAYLPVLIIAGVFTGVLTGFVAQFTLERLNHKHTQP